MNNDVFAGSVVLAGQFDPSTIALMLPPEKRYAISDLSGPPGVPMHSLAKGYSSRGIQTTLIGGARCMKQIHLTSDPLSVAIYPKRGGLSFVSNGLRRERNAVLELLKSNQPSIVHAHWTLEGARAVADWHGPKVLTVHDAAWEYARLSMNAGPMGLLYMARWLHNTGEVLKRFDHVIAVSPFVETYLRLRHRYGGEIRVIPNAVPELPFAVPPQHRYPKTGKITFGCYGGPGKIKNLEVAFRAFRQVRRSLPDARLLVFGSGWIEARKLDDRIEFRGALAHRKFLQALLEEVDIWVHPARIETHGLAMCEAIQAGCPVIGGRASGAVPWTLDYGRAGVLVDIEDPSALEQAMIDLALNPAKAQTLVEHGRHFIHKEFNSNRIIDSHLQFYKEIASR